MSKYVAYVGSFTFRGNSKGITIFDIDEKYHFVKRCEVAQDNVAYLARSHDNRFLYAAVDQGVSAFRIEPDGGLCYINTASIRGMRGCYLAVHPSNRFIAVAGYYDGKMTILSLNEDGSAGEITDEVYDQGIGSIAERNFAPHVCCVDFNKDGSYLFMADSGIDQIRIFEFSDRTGKVRMRDILHTEQYSAPRRMLITADNRFAYVLNELKNYIGVYNYSTNSKGVPQFEFKQLVSTLPKNYSFPSAAVSMSFSPRQHHLFCSNAGENTIAFYDIDAETGMLYLRNILPISGEHPLDVKLLPDEKHIVSVNHASNSLTFFAIDFHKNTLIMSSRPVKCDQPTCCVIAEAEG
ncbi:MAG: beta-propeller fold lactonase family protein [Lachnospiraceae bacterium]|nr:beta-propeller fold lactonase family protein [Lachnospiraceae bacterium]